jgi:dihydrodipicolinate synthase/N-acetylneuraminate lyase
MERMKKKYSGVIVPMVTPIDENFNIDRVSVARIVDDFVANGVAPFLLGTTGESFSVSEAKKRHLVDATVKAVNKRSIVYAGISSNCFDEAVEAGKAFADLGADVLVAHQPYYFPMNDDQMVRWFEDMANAVPLPLILYNNPITTKQSVPLSVIEKLSYHPNVVGFKDSERGMERLSEAIGLWKNRADFSHLLGWAAQSAYSVLNGSDGIIPSTGNFAASTYKALYDAAIAGNTELANSLQDKTNRLSDIYQKDRYINDSIPALKGIMAIKGLCQPNVLPPMFKCGDKSLEAMAQMLKAEEN